jgi:hypothetical protein
LQIPAVFRSFPVLLLHLCLFEGGAAKKRDFLKNISGYLIRSEKPLEGSWLDWLCFESNLANKIFRFWMSWKKGWVLQKPKGNSIDIVGDWKRWVWVLWKQRNEWRSFSFLKVSWKVFFCFNIIFAFAYLIPISRNSA